MDKKLFIILMSIVYVLTTGIVYTFFSSSSSGKITQDKISVVPEAGVGNDYQAITFDETAEKTEPCPLNGKLYSKEQRDWWETHRPLGVMIENHEEARPQSGISFADVVYEAVAEGGITRTLSVFYCNDAGIVGPVRSARTYFLDYISEYGEYPLYAHVGGANTPGPANALGQIGEYGWNQYNDMNQFSIGFPTFKRDESRLGHPVATEHTMYSVTNQLWALGKDRGLTDVDESGGAWDESFVPYTFKEDASVAKRPANQSFVISFWDNPNYAVEWIYDKATNTYQRENGGVPHMDRNPNKQVSAKNVVVLFMTEENAIDGYPGNAHMLYGTIGSGDALVFQDGKEIPATWKKATREARTKLFDSAGKEIAFNRGTIWFEIQPIGNTVAVQ